jgi:hypothetical protein
MRGAVLLIALLVVAGCADAPAREQAMAPPSEDAFDANTGAISGLVTDSEFFPIEGAQAWLADNPENVAETDAEGWFTLPDVEPGERHVVVQKVGYLNADRGVTVVVGEVAELEFILERVRFAEPFHVTREERGIRGCSFAWRPMAAGTGAISVCGFLTSLNINTDLDRFIIRWPLSGPIKDWHGGVFEMTWRPNQALGRGMEARWEGDGCSLNNPEGRLATTAGPPPHSIRVDDVQARIAYNAAKGCPTFAACVKDCRLQSRVFPVAETLGPSAPADVGVVVQQAFTQYLSEFYNAAAPEGFTALADV